ncbi:Tobamovirus multiplication protein 2A [Spatholobus suberectus]|nr:Tobamovirus multiplication protein 2A [Spatholobus suberectus]
MLVSPSLSVIGTQPRSPIHSWRSEAVFEIVEGLKCDYVEELLNFINSGLAMVGYRICLFVEYNKASDNTLTVSDDQTVIQLGRPMLVAVPLFNSFLDDLPKAWYECCSSPANFWGVSNE